MPKELTQQQIKQLEENANLMKENGFSDEDIQDMSLQYIEEHGVVKKKENTTSSTQKSSTSSSGVSSSNSQSQNRTATQFKPLTEQQKVAGKSILGEGTKVVETQKKQQTQVKPTYPTTQELIKKSGGTGSDNLKTIQDNTVQIANTIDKFGQPDLRTDTQKQEEEDRIAKEKFKNKADLELIQDVSNFGSTDLKQNILDYYDINLKDNDAFNRLTETDKQLYNSIKQYNDIYSKINTLTEQYNNKNIGEDAYQQELKKLNTDRIKYELQTTNFINNRNKDIDNEIKQLKQNIYAGKMPNPKYNPIEPQYSMANNAKEITLTDADKKNLQNQIKILEKQKGLFTDNTKQQEVIDSYNSEIADLTKKKIIPDGADAKEALKILYTRKYKQLQMLIQQSENEGKASISSQGGLWGKAKEFIADAMAQDFTNNQKSRAGYENTLRQYMIDDKTATKIYELQDELNTLAPIVLLNRYGNYKNESEWKKFTNSFATKMLPTQQGKITTATEIAQNTDKILNELGLQQQEDVTGNDIQKGKYSTGEMLGNTVAFMVQFGLAPDPISKALRGFKLLSKIPKLKGLVTKIDDVVKYSQKSKLGRFLGDATMSGINYETKGQIFSGKQALGDEATFESGFAGVLGEKTFSSLYKILGGNIKVLEPLIRMGGKGVGELGEETAQTIIQTAQEAGSFDEMVEDLKMQLPTMKDVGFFAISTFMMGMAFGANPELSRTWNNWRDKKLDALKKEGKYTEEDEKIVNEAISELQSEHKESVKEDLKNGIKVTEEEAQSIIENGTENEDGNIEIKDENGEDIVILDKENLTIVAKDFDKIFELDSSGTSASTKDKVLIANKLNNGEKLSGEEQDYYDTYKEEIEQLRTSKNENKITSTEPTNTGQEQINSTGVSTEKSNNTELGETSEQGLPTEQKEVQQNTAEIQKEIDDTKQIITELENNPNSPFHKLVNLEDKRKELVELENKQAELKALEQKQSTKTKVEASNTSNVEAGSVGVGGDVEATAKALEGVGEKETKNLYSIGKKIYDSIFSDLDTKESEIKAFLNIDEKQRDKQLQLEKGKLDKLQRQYDRKQLTTEADINALEKQREKVELIENLLKSQKGSIADIDNQLAQYALEKYPDIFTKKETYPFYTAKGFDNVKKKIISEAYHKAKADGSNPELVKAVEEALTPTPEVSKPVSEVVKPISKTETTKEGSVGVGGDVEIKNEGKADAPTKESVTERLNINNPFYKKVEDALVKLGLIERYNPETGTGDVVGGYAQQTSDGGFSVGKMLFSQDGSISYFDGDVKVSFDKNGNVISENTKEAKQKADVLAIQSKKESIDNLEKTRDSEAFKYKEITETDVLGNKKKVKRLKTEQELKESTDKINAAIDKAKAELSNLEQSIKETPAQTGSVGVGGDVEIKYGGKDKDLKGNPQKQWMKPTETSEQATNRLAEFVEASDYKGREQSAFIDRKGESVEVKLRNDDGKWNWYEPKSKKPFASFDNAKDAIKFIQEQPFWDNGELNKNGRNDAYFAKVKADHIKTELENGNILEDINDGKILAKDAAKIIESAGLKVPKDIADQSLKETTKAETPTKEGNTSNVGVKEGSVGVGGDVKYTAKIISEKLSKQSDDLVQQVYDKYDGEEASKKIKELFASKEYKDIEGQINQLNPVGADLSGFEKTLSESDAKDYAKYREIGYRLVAADKENGYKPFKVTESEKKQYAELRKRFDSMFDDYSKNVDAENTKTKSKAVDQSLKETTKAETTPTTSNQSEIEAKIADIPLGKVGNTEYEVRTDGVYHQGKKLNNPENKTHSQLIEADIERRRQEELTNLKVGDSYDVISSTGSYDGTWKVVEITDKFYRLTDNKGGKLNMGKPRVEENLKRPDGVTETKYRKSNRDEINAKYDAELAALESPQQSNEESKKADIERKDKEDSYIYDENGNILFQAETELQSKGDNILNEFNPLLELDGDGIKTQETRIDEDYNTTDAEYEQTKFLIPVYNVDWHYADNTNPDSETFDTLKDAVRFAQKEGDMSENTSDTPYNRIYLTFKEVWKDKGGNIVEEGDELIFDDALEELPQEIIDLFDYKDGDIATIAFESNHDIEKREQQENNLIDDIKHNIYNKLKKKYPNYELEKAGFLGQSSYIKIKLNNGRKILLRISNHNANTNNLERNFKEDSDFIPDYVFSIVIQNKKIDIVKRFDNSSQMQKILAEKNPNVETVQVIYDLGNIKALGEHGIVDEIMTAIENAEENNIFYSDFSGTQYQAESTKIAKKNQRLKKISIEKFNKLINKLKKAFPNVKVELYGKGNMDSAKKALEKYGVDLTQFLSVWHGSPHNFDKFSTDKMGTGEGAQAFGWGLYFTDVESIARGYADKLSKYKIKIGNKELSIKDVEDITGWKSWEHGDIERILGLYEDGRFDALKGLRGEGKGKEVMNYLIDNKVTIEKNKNLYKVSLHKGKTPEQYTWLEWDKDLSNEQVEKIKKALFGYEQPQGYSFRTNNTDSKYAVTYELINENNEIVGKGIDKDEALKNAGFGTKFYGYSSIETKNKEFDKTFKRNSDGKYTTGGGFYNRLSNVLGGDKNASLFLLENGIDGIKYPAESLSRGATSDTARGFNYVVFDENAVEIEEKIQFLKTKEGTIYGFKTPDGKVFINTDQLNANTPIHEFAHIWEQLFPKEFAKGIELLMASEQGRAYIKKIRQNPAYAGRTLDEVKAEALVTAIGDKGETIFNNNPTLLKKFQDWLKDFFKTIGDKLGIINLSADERFEDFTKKVVGDLLGGKELKGESKAENIIAFQQDYAIESDFKKDSKGNIKKDEQGNPILTEKAKKEIAEEYAEIEKRYNGKAPNGKPSKLTKEQWILTRTSRFKDWFGDWQNDAKNASKVVDENGEPLVVYHTTNNEFTSFDIKKSKEGFFFSPNKERLSVYNKSKTEAFYLSIDNPSHELFKSDINYLKEKGYNGIMDYGHAKKVNKELYEIVAFNPNQIKSATDNVGTFDAGNNDIRFQIEEESNTPQQNETVKNLRNSFIKLMNLGKDLDFVFAMMDKNNLIYDKDKITNLWNKTKAEIEQEYKNNLNDEQKTEDSITETETKESGGNRKKRTFYYGRAYLGDLPKEVKDKMSKYDFDYTIQNQAKAEKEALEIINDIGLETAFELAITGKIRGGHKAIIYSKALEDINEKMLKTNDQIEKENLQDVMTNILNEFSDQLKEGGQFSSMMARIYKNSNLSYNADWRIKKYKDANNGEIPKEVEERFKELEEIIKAKDKEIAELEQKQKEAVTNDAITQIKEKAKSRKKEKLSVKTRIFADKFRRKGKTKPPVYTDEDGNEFEITQNAILSWNEIVEFGAIAIETSASLLEAVEKTISKLEEQEWYQKLSGKNKKKAKDALLEAFDEDNIIDEYFKIPKDVLYDLVEKGLSENQDYNIDNLVDDVYDLLGDSSLDKRDLRDKITNYGEQLKDTRDDIEKKITELKRTGKLLSAYEDLQNGIMPKRSGLTRDEMTLEQRDLRKQINELLKQMPQSEEEQSKIWKSALDAMEKRLTNRIEELQGEIDKGERLIKEKNKIELTDKILSLKQKVNELQKERDEKLGKTELSPEAKIKMFENLLTKNIKNLEDTIRFVNQHNSLPETKPKEKISSERIEELKAERQKQKETLNELLKQKGIAEKKRIELAKKRVQKSINDLKTKLENKDFSKTKRKPLPFEEELNKARIDRLKAKEEFDVAMYKAELDNRTKKQKVFDLFLDILNLPKALKATIDLSAPLRQGATLLATHPTIWKDAFVDMHKMAKNENVYNERLSNIKNADDFLLMMESGLSITDTDAKLKAKEELFMTDLPKKIPVFKFFHGASERAYSGFLNDLRVGVFRDGVRQLQNAGITYEDDPGAYKSLAKMVNNATGRGRSVTKDEGWNKILNTLFFSPKMIMSRFGMIADMFSNNDIVRKMAIKNMAGFVAYYGTLTALSSLAVSRYSDDDDDKDALKNSFNPLHTDFMKMRKGHTTYDLTAGFSQIFRTMARVMSGKRINSQNKEYNLDGSGYQRENRLSEIGRFLSNKFSPSARVIISTLSNKHPTDYYGKLEDATIKDYIEALLIPMSLEQAYELYTNDEIKASEAFLMTLLATYGVGVQQESSSNNKNSSKLRTETNKK